MELTFIGHACFLLENDAGVRVLLDPYQPGAFGGRMGLKAFLRPVDVVVSSHDHLDHFHIDPAFGTPDVVRKDCVARGIAFKGVRLPHDAEDGASRGWVTGFRFELDGVSIVHPGDLGRPPTPDEVRELAPVDVLLLPVGGTFTMGPDEAMQTIAALHPRLVIPMHYLLPSVDLPLRPVEDFLALVNHKGWAVERRSQQPMAIRKADLTSSTQVLVLSPTHLSDQ
jgi:L-ascorbate metabolism protein UlaG (beta-lactamase superfamily)